MSKYLINGMWADITLYCGCHDKPIPMVIQQGPHSPFYACPNYFEENRTENERKCANRVNLVDFEKMIDHINEILCVEAMENNNICLDNHVWKMKGITFKILHHSAEKIAVSCINKPALTNIQR